jgi:IPT/TIG domain
MKKYSQKYSANGAMLVAIVGILTWAACTKSEDTSAPTIDRFRLTLKDSTIGAAGIGNTVAIIGAHLASTQHVYVNDYEVYLNPSYVKDDVVLIQLVKETPYRGQINKLKLVTLYGEAIKDFKVLQPAPSITSFAPTSGNPGDIVTIIGKDMDDVKAVLIGGDTVKVVAGGTDTQCKVIVPPANAAGQITVVTTGGRTTSATSFGVSLVIYGDKMASGWDAYEFDADRDMVSTEQVKKGKSIKMTFSAAYGGFGAGTADVIDIKKYSALKMSIYAKTTEPEVKVKIGIKGADGTTNRFSKIVILKAGWNDLTLDFITDLSKPDRFVEFQIQEWGNAKIPVIYIDDIGLL